MGSGARDVVPPEVQPLLITSHRDHRPVVTRRRFIQSLLYFALVIATSFAILSRIPHRKWWLGNMDGHPLEYCQRETFRYHKSFTSGDFTTGGSFSVLEERKDPTSHGHRISTSGSITFRRIPLDRTDDSTGYVTVEVSATDEELLPGVEEHVQFDADPKVLSVSSPWSVEGLPSDIPHCVNIEIVAWVPWDATFEHLKVATVSLGIEVFDDINVLASETASFKTTWGKIRFPGADESAASDGGILAQPRHVTSDTAILKPQRGINGVSTHIESASGSVSGEFALYHSISIHTQSSHISTILTPAYISGKPIPPAVLELSSKSGRIETHLPVDAWAALQTPERDYKTTVTTTSGSIRGSYYIGSQAEFKSVSGALSLVALGGMTNDSQSFTTSTISGSHQVEVLSAAQDSSRLQNVEAFRNLHSDHKSTSGAIRLSYPEQWEGKIDLQSMTGRLEASGDGVKVVSERRGHPRTLHAVKGDYEASSSVITGRSISDRIEVWVGHRD